jgi:tetratricopeptide (TPR) repeat protein
MTPAPRDSTAVGYRLEDLRRRALAAAEAGDLEVAAAIYDEAIAAAEILGNRDLVDLARCNRTAIGLELGEHEGAMGTLRQILMRSSNPLVGYLAAYTAGRALELDKDVKKALFYARIAAQRAADLGPIDRAASHNQIGNLLLAESSFDIACGEYELALGLMPGDDVVWRARILDNLGYCRTIQGRFSEAFALLYESLRTHRRHGSDRYRTSTHLALAFAFLERERVRHARRHARQALALSERFGDLESTKNALYLLGAAEQVAGNRLAAHGYFRQLERFYPDSPFMAAFLLDLDVRRMINLRA